MRVESLEGRIVQEAESDAERLELAREARALQACAHPGVVSLVAAEDGDPPRRLVLRRPPGGSWADSGRLPVSVLVGRAAAVASTLADLHELGWAHGALTPASVLLDDRGRPVLTGFSSAVGPDQPEKLGEAATADVAALAAMVLDRLPAGTDRKLTRELTRTLAAGRGAVRRPRPSSARHLARRLVDVVPGATLDPGATPDAGADPADADGGGGAPRAAGPRRRGTRSGALAALACVAIAVAAAAVSLYGWRSSPRTGAGPGGVPAPAKPISVPVGAIAAARTLVTGDEQYLLRGPGSGTLVTVEGRWGCGGSRPATLDPGSGWVWVFSRWPGPGSTVTATPVVRVVHAVGLAVRAAGSRCDDLIALERSGRQVAVPTGRTGGGAG